VQATRSNRHGSTHDRLPSTLRQQPQGNNVKNARGVSAQLPGSTIQQVSQLQFPNQQQTTQRLPPSQYNHQSHLRAGPTSRRDNRPTAENEYQSKAVEAEESPEHNQGNNGPITTLQMLTTGHKTMNSKVRASLSPGQE